MNRPIRSRILIVASVAIVLALVPVAALGQRGGFQRGGGFGGFRSGGSHGGFGGFHNGVSGFHGGRFGAFQGGSRGFHGGRLGGFHGGGFRGGRPGSFGGYRNRVGRFGGGFRGYHHHYPFYGGGYPWLGWGLGYDFGFWPSWGYPYWYGYGPGWGPYSYYYPYDPYYPYGSDDPRDDRDRPEYRDPCDYRYPDTCKSKDHAPAKPSNLNVREKPPESNPLNPGDVILDDPTPTISLIANRSTVRPGNAGYNTAISVRDGSSRSETFSGDRLTLRPAVRNAIRLLRAMPPEVGQQRLNSGRYDSFSPEEREQLAAAVQ